MKIYWLLAAILLFTFCSCQQTTPQAPEQDDVIHDIVNDMPVLSARGLLMGETTTLAERMDHYHVPGVSIAVIHEFNLEWAEGFGVMDADDGNPVTTSTLFQAASISKPVTAAAALNFVEQGKIELDQDVNDMLYSWQIPENDYTDQEKITLRRMLSHTAGLNKGSKFGYLQEEEIPTLQQVLNGENPAHSPPWHVEAVPGTHYAYSNGGYVATAQLLIDLAGKPFPDILHETLFAPLDMKSSTFENPLPAQYRHMAASAHGKWGQPIYGKWLVYPEYGAAALWTTPADLARFMNEIMLSWNGQSNKLLSQKIVAQMLTSHAQDVRDMSPMNLDYGLGWYLWENANRTFIVHGGDNPEGFQSLVIGLPEEGWGVVIMTNGANGYRLYFEILYQIASLYGIFPSLQTLFFLGYVLFFLLFLVLLGAIAYIVLIFRSKRIDKSRDSQRIGLFNRFRRSIFILVPLAAVVGAIGYFLCIEIVTTMAVDPTLETHQSIEALGMIEQGNVFAQHGMIDEAMAAYADAEIIDPEIEFSASDWNTLCWYGSLWEYAEEVLFACNHAVELAPDSAGIKDSRGLARALTGDHVGAIEDFSAYIEWLEKSGGNEYEKNLRVSWIAELELGRNPIDEKMKDELR